MSNFFYKLTYTNYFIFGKNVLKSKKMLKNVNFLKGPHKKSNPKAKKKVL